MDDHQLSLRPGGGSPPTKRAKLDSNTSVSSVKPPPSLSRKNSIADTPLPSSRPATPLNMETEAASSPQMTRPKKTRIQPDPALRKVFTTDELESVLRPVLEAVWDQDPESYPFRQPVDPRALGVPDYFNIIKEPMDLSTISNRLETGKYKTPWEFCRDMRLMFDNAWLYNKKTSWVYKYCTKLTEVFDSVINEAMQSLGYCCGMRYTFRPQILYCYGKPLCTIPRDTAYYGYQNSRYVYCPRCFVEMPGDTITVGDDPMTATVVRKSAFKEMKNDSICYEPMVECIHCGREMHKICILHHENIWTDGFQCENCLKAKHIVLKENKFSAKRLPPTRLALYLEDRINTFLRAKDSGAGNVTIRVVSSSDKILDTRTLMRDRFQGDFPESFPYRTKAMLVFEEIDGVDVCFFGMHVQEYGSDCWAPNTRRVYISYVDSVHFFRPRHLRTSVYHEIVIGYLEFCKNHGYLTAHFGTSPPMKGDDYIFHCHPVEQKIPTARRLISWCRSMLDKGKSTGVVYDYRDIFKHCTEGGMTSVTEIPYFEGDFWPSVIEKNIKKLDQEAKEREELQQASGEGHGPKKAENKSSKKGSWLIGGDNLLQKLYQTMEKYREVFFVVLLQPPQVGTASPLPGTTDPDQLISCDLMDGRDAFLTMSHERHWEFSSLRRAKYSTMAMLYELHNQTSDRFVYTCNHCRMHVETRYHCRECDDFDLCVTCYREVGHIHPMDKLGLGLDDDIQQDPAQKDPREQRKASIQRCIQFLVHASQCRDPMCKQPSCIKMKRVLRHTRDCKVRMSGNCTICKQFLLLCYSHAKRCTDDKCPVPICARIKKNLREQRAQSNMRQNTQQRKDHEPDNEPVEMEDAQTSAPTASPKQQPFKTESMLLFEEAMKQGYIEVSIIKCLLLGIAGVGKTCLLHLLLNMLPPQLRQSTACIEQAIRAICMKCGIDSQGEWEKVDSNRLRDHLAGSVLNVADANVPHFSASDASISNGKKEEVTTFIGPKSYTMGDIVKRLEDKPGLGRLQDMTWVYLVDSGGQPQFHELLTAFFRNAVIGIFVHKLSERLDDHPHVRYFDKEGKECGTGYRSPLSNRDLFQHCIQTVQSLPYTTEESTCPRLGVVGTFRDEEHLCTGESRNEKNKQLREILRPISDSVLFRTGMQEVIFPVNAVSPNDEDKEIARKLRYKIESLKPSPEKLPLKWYGLEQELETIAAQRNRWVFTKEECLQVAKRLHFPSDEALVAALVHLDKLNIFLYYPSVLPELVFCSPCVLLDKISELVEESCRLKHGPDPNTLVEGKFSGFCNKGLITAQLLEGYPKHYTECFTPAHLLKLFESLLIVAPINHDTYFMPSLLDVLKRSDFERPSCGCQLVISFKGRYAPLGLFSSLVAFLLSDKTEPNPWVFFGDTSKLYRNHITFYLDSYPGSVVLIDSAAFFEVYLTLDCTDLPELYMDTCRYVSCTIEMGLNAAIKARNFQNVRYHKAISCPCEEGNHTLHPALVHTYSGTQFWKCTKRQAVSGEVDEHHHVWVKNYTETSGTEADLQLENLLEKYRHQGMIKHKSLKCLFTGPPRTGKTTLKKRLLKAIKNLISLDEPSPSGGIENPISVFIGETRERVAAFVESDVDWQSQHDLLDEAQTVLGFIHQQPTSNVVPTSVPDPFTLDTPTFTPDPFTQDPFTLDPATFTPDPFTLDPATPDPPTLGPDSPKRDPPTSDPPTPRPDSPTQNSPHSPMEAVKHLMEEVLEKRGLRTIEDIEKTTTLYLIDTGGQPEFHEIMPIILNGPALHMIFFNLTFNFNEPVFIRFCQQDGTNAMITYMSSYTGKQMIYQLLSSLYCLSMLVSTHSKPTAVQATLPHSKPTAVLIGTHLDKLKDQGEKELEEINGFLKQLFSNVEFHTQGFLTYPKKDGRVFIPVNNYSGDEEEIKQLQRFLRQIIDDRFGSVPLPSSWLLFHLLLRHRYEKSPGVCTLAECRPLAKGCGLDEDDVPQVLRYIHQCLGTILFYEQVEGLNELVICDPNVLFKSIYHLVAVSFAGEKAYHTSAAEIRKTGEIPIGELQEHIDAQPSSSLLTNDHVIKLLKHFKILTELRDGMFFMPCLLQPNHSLTLTTEQLLGLCIPPLLVSFDGNYIPVGVFSALVVKLTQSSWEPDPEYRYRNYISFLNKDGLSSVVLIIFPAYLEFRIPIDNHTEEEPEEIHQFCMEVRKTVVDTLKAVLDLHEHTKKVGFQLGFYCPGSLQAAGQPHFARCLLSSIHSNPRNIICSKSPRCQSQCRLPHDCTIWFDYWDEKKGLTTTRGSCQDGEMPNPVDTTSRTASGKLECSQPQNFEGENVNHTPLGEDDLLDVTDYLQNMEKTHIYNLGLVLGLRQIKVKDMMDSPTFRDDVITAWLRKEDQVSEKGEPSWTVLVNALKHPRVGQIGIANNIALEHNSGAARDSSCAHEMVTSVDSTHGTTRDKLDCSQPQNLRSKNVDDTPLDERSLRTILDSISTLAADWFKLGVALRLSYDTLKTIECNYRGDAHRCLTEMVIAWLQMKDNLQPSWQSLASALSSPSVSRIEIATMIAAEHPPH